MNKRGLGWQLAASFALVAVVTALIAGLMLSIVWQRQFETYVRQGLQDTAEGYALSAGNIYARNGYSWPDRMSMTADQSMMSGLRVEVFDQRNRKLVDSADMFPAMNGGSGQVQAEPSASTIGAVAPIVVLGKQVGSVKVWSLSPGGLLSQRDIDFRSASTNALLVAAIIAIGLASATGAMYARGIVRPINHVTATAAALRSGKREARTGMEGPDAIGVLGRTLDEMADSIEADRQFERRLTADVAHELRTPLMAIQATVEAMQDGVLPADEKRLQTVRDETVRLARLADSILELARLERGAVPFKREPVDPADALQAALGTHRALLESVGLTLQESVEFGLSVLGDPDKLTQAFGNLISNAARYTPAGGTVRVSLAKRGDEAVVTVEDTGIGISAEDLDRVFVRFWRADAARSRATGGLGVGLAVVKEIVDRHSGRVDVRSEPGEGTAFAVSLPLAGSPAKQRVAFAR